MIPVRLLAYLGLKTFIRVGNGRQTAGENLVLGIYVKENETVKLE